MMNNPTRYLLFTYGEIFFGFPFERVNEMVKWSKLNPLPFTRDDLNGLLPIKGELVPIINLQPVFNSNHGQMAFKFILICEHQNKHFGFQIEDIHSIVELDPSRFIQIADSEGDHPTMILSNCDYEGKIIKILNLDKIASLIKS